MRRGEIPGAALVAYLGVARIRMTIWAKFQIVGASAEVAKQRLAGGDSVTLVAVMHGGFQINENF